MKNKSLLLSVVLVFPVYFYATAQQDDKGWHLLDLKQDSFYGISLQRTYQFLQGKSYKPVIVAVIDSGIDTLHEDLKNILWTNPKEIPGNGIDDDGNGYIDDIHGWNFLGNKNGNNLKKDIGEVTRVYYRYKSKFAGRDIDIDSLSEAEKDQYHAWKKASEQMNADSDEETELRLLGIAYKTFKKHDEVLCKVLDKKQYTGEELEKFQPSTQAGKQAKMGYLTCLKLLGIEADETNTAILSDLNEEMEEKQQALTAKSVAPPNYREQIIKDDYFNLDDKFYGNNDVMGPGPMHGTHVSGIIAADRLNGIGIDGIADHVKIMMIRAVPEGDEYDKDVALAIRYATDNGAKIINLSFGKSFSPEKNWVDDAIYYAQSKDVLIVHAAGNDARDIDKQENYPNPELKAFHLKANNFITVGASGDPRIANGKLVADFSNYGHDNVDVFAPGVKIYSTLPGGNEYGFEKGTSFSAPIVAGIAALIRSYYPGLSAKQVKYAIEKSAIPVTDTLHMVLPGDNQKVTMYQLCKTGGLVNAYAALQMASTLVPEADIKQTITGNTVNNTSSTTKKK